MTCVKILWNKSNVSDHNVFRRRRIQSHNELSHRHSVRKLNVSDHAASMNSCVGSAGTMHCEMSLEQFAARALEFTLHRTAIILDLPAGELRPVVFYEQRNFHGGCNTVPQ
jgi:hypothetical protein